MIIQNAYEAHFIVSVRKARDARSNDGKRTVVWYFGEGQWKCQSDPGETTAAPGCCHIVTAKCYLVEDLGFDLDNLMLGEWSYSSPKIYHRLICCYR